MNMMNTLEKDFLAFANGLYDLRKSETVSDALSSESTNGTPNKMLGRAQEIERRALAGLKRDLTFD